MVRWEESKKWKKKVDILKSKLKEKTEECQSLNKSIATVKEALVRQEKDKNALQSRLKRCVLDFDLNFFLILTTPILELKSLS